MRANIRRQNGVRFRDIFHCQYRTSVCIPVMSNSMAAALMFVQGDMDTERQWPQCNAQKSPHIIWTTVIRGCQSIKLDSFLIAPTLMHEHRSRRLAVIAVVSSPLSFSLFCYIIHSSTVDNYIRNAPPNNIAHIASTCGGGKCSIALAQCSFLTLFCGWTFCWIV